MSSMETKFTELKNHIRELGSLAVGFSGGVDSSFLLAVSHEVLGDKVIAVTAVNAAIPDHEISDAAAFCTDLGIRQFECRINPLSMTEFRNNAPDRCYHCKKLIFSEIKRIAGENGIEYVAEGSNTDDLGDYRPGMKAVEELGIKSPLREARLSKREIRLLSKEMGLPTWSKPSYACLASRFVYGEEITEEKLLMVERAEHFLIEKGFHQERVRLHGNLARIEVPAEDIQRLASDGVREAVYEYFRQLGFSYVTIDVCGYRTGSMNEVLV